MNSAYNNSKLLTIRMARKFLPPPESNGRESKSLTVRRFPQALRASDAMPWRTVWAASGGDGAGVAGATSSCGVNPHYRQRTSWSVPQGRRAARTSFPLGTFRPSVRRLRDVAVPAGIELPGMAPRPANGHHRAALATRESAQAPAIRKRYRKLVRPSPAHSRRADRRDAQRPVAPRCTCSASRLVPGGRGLRRREERPRKSAPPAAQAMEASPTRPA